MTTDATAMTRRRLLGRVPAVAATTLVPVAFNAMGEAATKPDAMSGADPIFAVIAEHKAAFETMQAFFSDWFVECAEDDPDGLDENEVLQRHDDAFTRLFTTRATTVAGVAAWLHHIGSPGYMEVGNSIIAGIGGVQSTFRETIARQALAMADVLRENA